MSPSHHSPEIGDGDEAVLAVREAALVDDQARVDLAGDDRVEDPVVAKLDHVAERRRGEAQEQERRRLPAGHGDASGGDLLQRALLARDDERADAAAERGAAAQQPVPVAGRRRRAEAQLRQLELAVAARRFSSSMSSRTGSTSNGAGDEPVHERVERERVVRARREAEAEPHVRPKNHFSSGFSSSSRVNGRTCSPCPSRSETVKSSSSVSFASWRQSPSS